MSYAVIQLAGKQHKVAVGDKLTVNRLDRAEDQTWTINDVLLTHDGKKPTIGQPLVDKASVTLKVLKHTRGDKIRVATYKAKSRYRRVKGHRQDLTQVEITKITA